ncbi:MAG: tetratricopeptide repeat protein [Synechococcaceae cyanobacterium]|nr:tetratricopeptide repeat protein [Synechococcaceae cyanobacterium]
MLLLSGAASTGRLPADAADAEQAPIPAAAPTRGDAEGMAASQIFSGALPVGSLALGLLTAGGLVSLRQRRARRDPAAVPQTVPHHPASRLQRVPGEAKEPAADGCSTGQAKTAEPGAADQAPSPRALARRAEIARTLAEPGARLAICGPVGSGRRFLAEAFAAAELAAFPAGTLQLDGSQGFAEAGLQLLAVLQARGTAAALSEGETLQELLRRSWRAWSASTAGASTAGASAAAAAALLLLFDLPSDEAGQTLEQRLCLDLPPTVRRLVSQRSDTGAGGRCLALGGMEEPAALRLLRGPVPLAATQEEACRSLVNACGGLPFPLALLARRAVRRDPADWPQTLARLQALEPEARLGLAPRSPLAETPQAAAVLLLLWHELDGPAQRLALLLGAMGPAPVPTALLEQCAAIDPQAGAWTGALDALQGAGLVCRDAAQLRLHPLVRQFLRGQGRREAGAENAARALLVAGLAHEVHGRLAGDLSLAQRLPLAPLLPHLRAVLLRERRRLPDGELLWPAIAVGRLLEGLEAEADGRLLQHCLEICEGVLGPNHPDTAVALLNLAGFHDSAGTGDARAEALLRQALAVRQRCFGEAHPATAAALARLGVVLAERGELASAIPLLEHALVIQEQAQGAHHPDLLGPLHRLLEVQEAHGAHARAERLARRVLEIQQQQLGEGHPELATTLLRLGQLQEQQGRPERAEALYEQALTLVGGVPGADGTAAAILGRLGALAFARGEEAEAEQRYRQALALLAGDQPEAGRWLHDLARLHLGRGELEDAERLTRELLALRERTAGPWHPLTATVLNELAWLLSQRQPSEESLQLCERALAIRRRHLGAYHLETAASLNTLAALHEQRDDCETALPLYQQALEISEQQLGPDHPGSRTVRANLHSCSERLERQRQNS